MSIFKRSSGDAPQAAATETVTEVRQSDQVKVPIAPAASGVVPPAAAPLYSTRVPETAARADNGGESVVAEKVRIAREAQQSAQDRVRVAVRRTSTTPSPAPGVKRGGRAPQPMSASTSPRLIGQPSDPSSYAQAGLLNLAWRWQEAGAPIRAIHTYVELLQRYPDTPAAAAAVADLVTLSQKLADEGQFHTALQIYDQLEQLI